MDTTLIKKLIGSQVEKIEASDSGSLVLYFTNSSGSLEVPSPWTFTSCLESVSSETGQNRRDVTSDLIGLEGAQLSSFDADENHIDLHFGSITISAAI